MMRCEARRRGGGGVECWVAIIHSFVWARVLACLLACLPFNHTPAEVERGRQRESEGGEWEMTTAKDVVGVRER